MFTTSEAWAILKKCDTDEYTVMSALVDTIRKYADAGETLLTEGRYLRSRLDGVDAKLTQDYHVNSIGELQSAAHDYDRACVEREVYASQAVMIRETLIRVGAITADRMGELLAGTPFGIDGER